MEPTQSNSGQSGAAAAGVVAPDPQTQELLLRRAAGEKLSPSEYGRLGSFARWLAKPFAKGGDAAQPGGAGSQSRNAAALATGEPAQASSDGLAAVEIDSDLCKSVTAALLGRANIATVGWIEREANSTADAIRLSGAERDKVLNRFRLAANLKAADQALITDLSPDVFRAMGIDPRQVAVYAVLGILGLHGFNLWQCVQELKDLRRSTQPEEKTEPPRSAPEPARTPGAANREGVSTQSIPNPAQPRGGPPIVI